MVGAITHVIFDVDGLLLDTERLYTQMFQKMCESYGREFSYDVKLRMMGKKQEDAAQVFADEYDPSLTFEKYKETVDDYIRQLFPDAALMPGAKKLVQHLHRHGIPLAIATGSHREEYQLKIQKHADVFDLFQHAVMSSDDPEVKHGKPAPDCFLVAARRFLNAPPPDKVLVFEDAPNGVEGALAAGMQVVWVPDPLCSTAELGEQASQVLTSLEQFNPQDFGLPAYEEEN